MSYYGGGGYSYSGSYGRGRGRGGGGVGGGGAGASRYYGAAGDEAYYNPEFFERERYEGSSTGAGEDSFATKRKMVNVTICVDYIRGFCPRGSRCPKPHVDYVESMSDREFVSKTKFCHDFQNHGLCGRRKDCKFLHVTRREDDEFLLTGTIPQSVFTRMREWSAESSMYNSFGDGPPSSYSGYDGSGIGRKRPHPDSYSSPRGGFQRGVIGRGGFRARGEGGGGHASGQPVTFENYCIDYLKGTCVKGDVCYLRHVETIDNPDDRQGLVKQVFCHDFQNSRCKRPFCKYVHASREEESFFLENGYFPPSMNARNREKQFFSDICLDFLRNQCIRGASCQFKHVQKVEAHSERVCLSRSIFCHDFQETDCVRPNCKMIHTSAQDEQYFLDTGMLPAHLKIGGTGGGSGGGGGGGGGSNMSKLASNVCREYVKNQCTRGNQCRFYHPPPHELEKIISHQTAANPGTFPEDSAAMASLEKRVEELSAENGALKTRNEQLERLLADACYCMSLAVGDQNPAIAQLMKTITEMAPESALARQGGSEGSALVSSGGVTVSETQGGQLSIAGSN